jgi:hypothetical protein
MQVGTWVLEKGSGTRFPYRVQIRDSQMRLVLSVWAQDRWPGANKNIFCLRDRESVLESSDLVEVERASIVALRRTGPRLSLVLDRPRLKRCDFLIVQRPARVAGKPTREEIYWQTQASMSQRRPKVAPSALRRRSALTVRIASEERYPWSFPGSEVQRARLASGDYALMQDGEVSAVVERKTFENLLADFGVMPVLHQRLLELSTHRYNALVIEAPYEDFLNSAKVHHYTPAFCAAVIAEMYVRYPSLRVVFCSNRKTANLWARRFFEAVAAAESKGDSQAQR